MIAGDIVKLVNEIRPNSIPDDVKYTWLDELERKIDEDVLEKFQDSDSYDGIMDAYAVLLAPDRAKKMYIAHLCAEIDYTNGEIERYNNDAQLFTAEWEEYVKYVYRTYHHIPAPRFNAL